MILERAFACHVTARFLRERNSPGDKERAKDYETRRDEGLGRYRTLSDIGRAAKVNPARRS
jgi:hypothetical protein